MKKLLLALLLILQPSLAFAGNTSYEQLTQYAFVNAPSASTDATFTNSGTGQAVVAVANKKIRIIHWYAHTGSVATTFVFNSKPSGAGAAISSTKAFAANTGAAPPCGEYGCFETKAGEVPSVTTGTGSTIGVDISFIYE